MTYDGVLVYNDNRVIMNEGDYRLYSPDNTPYYYIDGTHPCWFDKPLLNIFNFLFIAISSLKVNVLIMNLVK